MNVALGQHTHSSSASHHLLQPPPAGGFGAAGAMATAASHHHHHAEEVAALGDECTQMETLDPELLAAEVGAAGEAGAPAPTADPTAPWGKLIPMDDSDTSRVVQLRPCAEGGGRRLNEVLLGRGAVCDVVVPDRRVSSRHCRLFCARAAADGGLEVFIEDLSSNGTWINGSNPAAGVHLSGKQGKQSVRKLHSGEEIYLINPRKVLGAVPPNTAGVSAAAAGGAAGGMCAGAPGSAGAGSADAPQCCTRFTFYQYGQQVGGSSVGGAAVAASARASGGGGGGRGGGGGGGDGPPQRDVAAHYSILNQLGHGTSGEVRLGRNNVTGEEVAIKIVEARRFALSAGGLTSQELAREAEMLRAVSHPNVIRLLDVFHSGGRVYLIMEYVRGGDLFDRIVAKGRYSEDLARQLLVHVLKAVEHLHAHDIVHRDLKPENILLVSPSDDVDIKITDFGLAKRSASGDALKTYCGTPQYFAPEVLQRRNTVLGTGRYGKAADMWSLGIILYVLLSGTHPFHDNTLYEQIQDAYYSFEGPEWVGISEAAKDLVCRLVTANPADRLTATEALRHPFCRGAELAVPTPRTTSIDGGASSPRAAAEAHRRRGGAAAAAAAADAAAAGRAAAAAAAAAERAAAERKAAAAADASVAAAAEGGTPGDGCVLTGGSDTAAMTESPGADSSASEAVHSAAAAAAAAVAGISGRADSMQVSPPKLVAGAGAGGSALRLPRPPRTASTANTPAAAAGAGRGSSGGRSRGRRSSGSGGGGGTGGTGGKRRGGKKGSAWGPSEIAGDEIEEYSSDDARAQDAQRSSTPGRGKGSAGGSAAAAAAAAAAAGSPQHMLDLSQLRPALLAAAMEDSGGARDDAPGSSEAAPPPPAAAASAAPPLALASGSTARGAGPSFALDGTGGSASAVGKRKGHEAAGGGLGARRPSVKKARGSGGSGVVAGVKGGSRPQRTISSFMKRSDGGGGGGGGGSGGKA